MSFKKEDKYDGAFTSVYSFVSYFLSNSSTKVVKTSVQNGI